MRLSTILPVLSGLLIGIFCSADQVVLQAINDPCTGANNAAGVCINTSQCTSGGGKFISNACPGTPDNIKCCSKPVCGTAGSCRWTSQCASGGTTLSGLCPGPSSFKCCYPPDPRGN